MIGRVAAYAALAAAAVALAITLLGDRGYTVHARFVDAGQMVPGGLVQVAGRRVGTVKDVSLDPDGTASLRLDITDGEWRPLRRGTTARVRTVGLSGVANRYIDLDPGPSSGAEIPDGGVLSTAETRPIVDLDVLLNSFDERTRKRFQRLVRSGGELFAGTARDANRAFGYLAPALAQSSRLASELARDRVAVERLVRTGATTASALASRSDDIEQGISATARTLRAVASERDALSRSLRNAPALLERADGVLGGVRETLAALRPTLREARPVTAPLTRVLRRLVPVSRAARPVLADTRSLLPALTAALSGAPALERTAVPALGATVGTLTAAKPIVDGLIPYTPDLIGGFINGFGNKQTGYYDANGHYGRISLEVGPGSITGLLGSLSGGAVPKNVETGRTARCPGGAAEAADDRSNPFRPDPSLCDPEHDRP